MRDMMLTTHDNPFNYFTQFDDWLAFDERNGYYTLNIIARTMKSSEELNEAQEEEAIDQAIENILQENLLLYKKVYANVKD